ncbi:glucose-6-phosphate dehydrogenase [Algimonas porphyrae]|uniref:Glucose-6-phosphate 1-dehydrogenase n=1 Tax=Algimonas porphyrae TaxID=1128113 RepID=A0ABQ5UVF2_9PROT|nr:glucose-6-phosphate dehydrogenase [Algimonas porphyrae]GLQ19249.1 glucose-6-phosphate 1-dehydrogenase [Algimonas porphyrae]
MSQSETTSTDPSDEKTDMDEGGRSAFVPVDPFELVVFGATGDLARRKLLPSLYHRYCDGQIPEDSRIIGASRTAMDREEFVKLVEESYLEFEDGSQHDPDCFKAFADMLDYVAIDIADDQADWDTLGGKLDATQSLIRIFYLAMPPRLFVDIAEGLQTAGLAHDESRVVLEKPLGNDFASADAINEGVGRVFDENRIYRIDHYLGKETVQNLLVLRFGNILLEPLWNSRAIEHIEITVAETIGVGGRGAYYDSSGALRDMVQNHLLQLLCLTTMEPPASIDADDLRTEKIKVLRALRPVTSSNVKDMTVRAQYVRGRIDGETAADYLSDVDVEESDTETFVAIHTEIQNWRWSGVPIYIRTGKRMAQRRSEIIIQFRPVPHSIFPSDTHIQPNRLVIRLQPDEAVTLWMEIKEPGAGGLRLKTLPLNLSYADSFAARYPDAYERLLLDVVRGNLSLFMRRDEVEAAWRWVDGIIDAWAETEQRLSLYPAGTDGPDAARFMLEQLGDQWSDPGETDDTGETSQ